MSYRATRTCPNSIGWPSGQHRCTSRSSRRRDRSSASVARYRKQAWKFHRGLPASPSPSAVEKVTGALSNPISSSSLSLLLSKVGDAPIAVSP